METKISNIPVGNNQLLHRGQVVATGAMIAEQLGCTSDILSDNFTNNRIRHLEGDHYFHLTGPELKAFRLQPENFGLQISAMTRSYYLWTEKGAKTCTIFVVHGE